MSKNKKLKQLETEAKKKKDKLYESDYGSHQSMVVEDLTLKIKNIQFHTVEGENQNFVVCKDENGLYLTNKSHLDNNLADGYRFSSIEWRQSFLRDFADILGL